MGDWIGQEKGQSGGKIAYFAESVNIDAKISTEHG
jgi:hypothetical protein